MHHVHYVARSPPRTLIVAFCMSAPPRVPDPRRAPTPEDPSRQRVCFWAGFAVANWAAFRRDA